MNVMKKAFLFLLLLTLIGGCRKKNVADTRSFYMGVTPWPADFTGPELENAYTFISNNCDMVSHHFDDGVPWEEAWQQGAMPVKLQQELSLRIAKTAPGKKILLSVAPLNLTRKEKAEYYAKADPGITDSIKQYWHSLDFNDPKVVTAYTRYVSWLIDRLHPDFVNYGVESTVDTWDPGSFSRYKIFLAAVYAALKSRYPALPFFVSFMVYEFPVALTLASELLPYTDYIALSAYPYSSVSSAANGNTDPSLFPADYFTRFLDLAPGKPFAIAETGYIAEDLDIPSFGLHRRGTAAWQKAYLEKIATLANERKAKFIIWFCHKDYDAGNITLQNLGLYQDLFGLWEDTGLVDEAGNERPALRTWMNWLNRRKTN